MLDPARLLILLLVAQGQAFVLQRWQTLPQVSWPALQFAGASCAVRRGQLVRHSPRMQQSQAAAESPAMDCDARSALASFQPTPYVAPWWARNQHVNTIVGALAATPRKPTYERQRWNTPDGDFVDIDFLNSTTGFSRGMVLLYHGLESTTMAPLTVRQAFALAEEGFDVAAVSFRGCSGEDNLTPGAYHLGFTADIRYIAEVLHTQRPDMKSTHTHASPPLPPPPPPRSLSLSLSPSVYVLPCHSHPRHTPPAHFSLSDICLAV